MEIDFFSTQWHERERFYSQSILVFVLVLGLTLWSYLIVFADPSLKVPAKEDSRVPLSDRVFDSSGEWRAPQEPENSWRESEQNKMTLEKGRIKKKSSSLYNPTQEQDNWDPYSSPGHPDTLTKPAKVFKFKF